MLNLGFIVSSPHGQTHCGRVQDNLRLHMTENKLDTVQFMMYKTQNIVANV